MVLMEQKRQVLMVKISLFGEIADETKRADASCEALKKAIDFMTLITKAYAAGEIADKAGLKLRRDEKLKELEVPPKTQKKKATAVTEQAHKRPAAAPEEEPATKASKQSKKDGAEKLAPIKVTPVVQQKIDVVRGSAASSSNTGATSVIPPMLDSVQMFEAFFRI